MRKFLLVLSFFAMVRCSDDDPKKETCKLTGQRYARLTYNLDDQVETIIQLDEYGEVAEGGYTREFQYDNTGKLIRIDEFIGETLSRYFLFEYSNNKIVQKEHFIPGDDDDETVDYTTTYTLNSQGKVIQLDHESWNLDEPFSQIYEYENKNVVKVTRTALSGNDNYIQEFEYDNYPNPLSLEGFELYFNDNIFNNLTQNQNNTVKSTFTVTGRAPSINTYTYTYNSSGYPTERFTNGGSTPSWFYEYTCK